VAALDYAIATLTTPHDITSSSVWETVLTLSSSNLTAGHKYLILCTANLYSSSAAASAMCHVLHGSTEFADSLFDGAASQATANAATTYRWVDVWTAVSSENLVIEHKGHTGQVSSIDQIVLIAIDLNDLTENTDWFFSEYETDDTLTTTPQTGASITFTPSGVSDWLVISNAQYYYGDNTTSVIHQITRSGEASSSIPSSTIESYADPYTLSWLMNALRVFALTASSNTFAEQSSQHSGTTHTRLSSRMFALNLDVFENHGFAYTEADQTASTTSWANQIQTLDFTPDTSGPCVIGSWHGFDTGGAFLTACARLQIDNTDDPATQTSDAQTFGGKDARDEATITLQTVLSATGSTTYTIDVDGHGSSTSSTWQYRTIFAFSLELAGGGGGSAALTTTLGTSAQGTTHPVHTVAMTGV